MEIYNTVAILLSTAALLSYLNRCCLKLPTTIGIMTITFSLSLGLIVLQFMGLNLEEQLIYILRHVDFSKALLNGMLSFLLFAGALHVNLEDLVREKWIVGTLSTISVLISAGVIGVLLYFILPLLGFPLPFVYCLLFGALISPTDPIAVLSMLKQTPTPKSLRLTIAGESLFNDGIGVVLFLVVLDIAMRAQGINIARIGFLFLTEAVGGLLFGFLLGLIAYVLLKQVDDYQVEVLLTLALVAGGYALASAIHISGPLAMVIAGLFIGNHGKAFAMSARTRERLDAFWELIDEILNAILFMLIGLEVLLLARQSWLVVAGLSAIPTALVARFISVWVPVELFSIRRQFLPHAVAIFTWSGLRGGISLALALTIQGSARELILAMTYSVVAFSIIVQGISMKKLLKACLQENS